MSRGNSKNSGKTSDVAIGAEDASGTAATIILDSPNASDSGIASDVSSGELLIWPVRSYLDGKEIRRAGGKGYRSPKHDALLLIAEGLATDQDPDA